MTQVDRMWRRVVIWSAAAVVLAGVAAVLALSIASKVVSDAQDSVAVVRSENRQLRDQVETNNQQAGCRSRISSAAQAVESEANSLLRQALTDRFVAGRSESLQPAADRMNLLNKRVQELGDLRSRSVEICAANPDFIP